MESQNKRANIFKAGRIFSKKEKAIAWLLIAVIAGAGIYWFLAGYFKKAEVPALGRSYTEGVIGQPKYINPVLAQANTPDRDLCALVYSSLIKYNPSNDIEFDLAKSYDISDDGREYTFELREGIKWHDGEPFKSDDVVFTFQSIKNPSLQSPLATTFADTEAEKLDDYTIKFTLKEPFAPFISNLDFGIIPKHLWEMIEPVNTPLAELNLQPIGTGPYKFKDFKKDKMGNIISFTFESFNGYFKERAHIKELAINFFDIKEDAEDAFAGGEIDGIAYDFIAREFVEGLPNISKYKFSLPRYNAVFFNTNNNADLQVKSVREALTLAINKEELVNNVLGGDARKIDGPILENFSGYKADLPVPQFDNSKANDLIHKAGWNTVDEEGYRTKEGKRLKFTLYVSDFEEHVRAADFLKQSWKNAGVEADVQTQSPADIQDKIRSRNYDAVLFGQVVGHDPDPYSFWHSSQRDDPGLNLISLKDSDSDALLADARKSTDEGERAKKYESFQQKLIESYYAIFLYSPYYLYAIDDKVKGIEEGLITTPSERFSNVEAWYIKTKRE